MMTSSGRPITSMRRIPTADGRKRADINAPVGLTADVSASYRPITGMGISGMKNQAMGPQRQIASKSYYTTEVNRRSAELSKEIESMRTECTRIVSDNEKYGQYEKKYDTIFADVRTKESELADINLALGKVATNTSIDDIEQAAVELKKRNQHERETLDDVFAKAKKIENDWGEIEARLDSIRNQTSQAVYEELGADSHAEYVDLQDEQAGLSKAIVKKEEEVSAVESKIFELTRMLKSPEYQATKQAFELRKTQTHLKLQLQDLQEETSANLSPAELRDLYSNKIKAATKQVESITQRTADLEQKIENYQDEIESKETQLKSAKRLAVQERKLEAVYAKARRMNTELEAFPNNRREQLAQQDGLKKTIVALLKHLNEEMGASEDVKNTDKFDELKEDFAFKESKSKHSEKTLNKVKEDLNYYNEQLTQIKELETKIEVEIEELEQDMESKRGQLGNFMTPEQLQEHHHSEKKRLMMLKGTARMKREAAKLEVHALSKDLERSKSELASSDVNKRLDGQEYKLRTRSQLVYDLQTFIDSRKRESDYADLQKHVLSVRQEINKLIVDNMKN